MEDTHKEMSQQGVVGGSPERRDRDMKPSLEDQSGTTKVELDVPAATYKAAQLIEQAAIELMDGWQADVSMYSRLSLIGGVVLSKVLPALDQLKEAKEELSSDRLAFFDALYVGLKPIISRYV